MSRNSRHRQNGALIDSFYRAFGSVLAGDRIPETLDSTRLPAGVGGFCAELPHPDADFAERLDRACALWKNPMRSQSPRLQVPASSPLFGRAGHDGKGSKGVGIDRNGKIGIAVKV